MKNEGVRLLDLHPDKPIVMTPRQVNEHAAMVAGKVIAEYHKHYHTSMWKKLAMWLAAEGQSFRMAVNEEYGPKHERGEMVWQRFVRWLKRPFEALGRQVITEHDELIEEGEAAIRHVDKRAGH